MGNLRKKKSKSKKSWDKSMVRVISKQRNYCHGANRKKSRNLFGVGVKSFSRVAKKTPRDKDKDSVVKRSSSCRSNRKFEKTLKKILKS